MQCCAIAVCRTLRIGFAIRKGGIMIAHDDKLKATLAFSTGIFSLTLLAR
jgi:hypothetical protein